MDTATAALISASLATIGWLYAARRARALSRKQHTVTVMLQANFNEQFQRALKKIRPYVKGQPLPAPLESDPDLADAIRLLLNHFEFIAAGLRNGDFDEQLVIDTDRSKTIQLYEFSREYIWSLRNDRKRMSLYEHLEWVHARWTDPKWRPLRAFAERVRQKPFQGKRHDHRKSVAD